MTTIDEILICANQLANAGKKPTVALIKAKLTQRAPLATIINTLKNWQHQPDFIAAVSKQDNKINKSTSTSDTTALLDSLLENGAVKKIIEKSLEQELAGMRKELSEMKLLIKNLTEQLDKSK